MVRDEFHEPITDKMYIWGWVLDPVLLIDSGSD